MRKWRAEHYGPHGRYVPWLWHALLDGTLLCYCKRSQHMKVRTAERKACSYE